MVAAHAYDLRGAKAVGMKTVYVYRWTDDVLEDQKVVREENDIYLEDMQSLDEVIARL
jgi:FMN phosphatase YigB (HAD superfamily)